MKIEQLRTTLKPDDDGPVIHIELTKDGANLWTELTKSVIFIPCNILAEILSLVSELKMIEYSDSDDDDDDDDDLLPRG